MSNKLSKSESNSYNTPEKNQSKFDEGSQSKFDGYICQSCEERKLQIEYAPSEWSIDTSKVNIEYVCDQKLCKWYKN